MSFSEFAQDQDIVSRLGVVNEVIPITGTLFSGSPGDEVKNYINITSGSAVSGGFWETIFDGAPSSISSSALVDLTYGHSSASLNAGFDETFLNTEKQRVYRHMSKLLLGDVNAFFSINDVTRHELFFLSFKRRIFKDEIKKGDTTITIQMSGAAGDTLDITDTGAASNFTEGPGGEEASLFSGSTEVGKLYYQTGIAVLMTGAFIPVGAPRNIYWSGSSDNTELSSVSVSGNIDHVVDGLRNRINQVQFNNQTNLHETIYFCRAKNSEFNYSTNPTFIDSDGRILPTSGTENQTRTYITKVGLADINNNILAVASLSEPVKKSPDVENVISVKLSF